MLEAWKRCRWHWDTNLFTEAISSVRSPPPILCLQPGFFTPALRYGQADATAKKSFLDKISPFSSCFSSLLTFVERGIFSNKRKFSFVHPTHYLFLNSPDSHAYQWHLCCQIQRSLISFKFLEAFYTVAALSASSLSPWWLLFVCLALKCWFPQCFQSWPSYILSAHNVFEGYYPFQWFKQPSMSCWSCPELSPEF